ncbi:MAG: zinc ribbon domain-containing protein [Aggregatilineales bacterium]
MNKAQIKVELNELLTIDNVVYHVAEHPALPGVPYIQRGARGFVIQLRSPSTARFALKYFKLKYRVPELATVGKALRQYAQLPGLRAASRTVFTAQTHPALIRKYPALEYGMLMPWIPGTTWFDIITRRIPLTSRESVQLAQAAAHILATLEANNLAHCDIAGANVMVERAAGVVELVDIEEMYGPGLPRPVELPAGQDGYQHRASVHDGQWTADGDRFSGAILIAELLIWHNARIRDHSADEHYFAASEMQQPDSPHYKLLREALRAEYPPDIADQFDTVWRSTKLSECPPLSAWQAALDKLDPSAAQSSAPLSTGSPTNTNNSVISGRRALLPNSPPNQVNSSSSDAPVHIPIAASIPTSVKLCPNCGAQNPLNAEFCANCHYYLRSSQRAAAATNHPAVALAQKVPGVQASSQPLISPSPSGAPPLISARRMVGPGQSRQIVPTPELAVNERGDGRWIIVALVIGAAIAIILLTLISH